MRKIISLIVALVLAFPLAVFAQPEDELSEDLYSQRANEILNLLKITDYKPEGLNNNITRSQFIKIVSKMALIGESTDFSGIRLFSDVPADNEYAPYIYGAVRMGITTGFYDGTFKPEQEISVLEAVTTLARLIGYGYKADAMGGYPAGYLAVSHDLRLLGNTKCGYNDILTKADASVICLNALETDIMKQTAFGEEKKFEVQKDVNLLSQNFDIKHIDGIVDGIDLTRLRGANNISPYHVSIDGTILDIGDTNVNTLLGYKVEAYYYDNEDDEPVLKYVYKNEADNYEVDIDIKDVKNIENYEISAYDEDGDTSDYTYLNTAAIIYNGASTKSAFKMGLLKDKTGTLKLLDNNDDGVFDIIFVNVYKNYVVSQTDPINYTIFDLYNKQSKIKLDISQDDPYVLIYGTDKKETVFAKIKTYSVVTVYESLENENQQFIKAYISESKTSGVIEEFEKTDDGAKVKLNGKEYELTKECYDYNSSKLENCIGETTEILLDINGYAAYMTFSGTGGQAYGYLVDAMPSTKLDHIVSFKIFTAKGEFLITNAAKKVKIDDKTYKSSEAEILTDLNASSKIANEITANDCYAQLIRYMLNSNGEVLSIDTIMNRSAVEGTYSNSSGDNSLYMVRCNAQYKLLPRSFSGQTIIAKDAVVFNHPPVNDPKIDYKNEDLYQINNVNYFRNDTTYSVKVFYTQKRKVSGEAVTIQSSGSSILESSPLAIFVKATDVIDKDGEEAKKMTVYQNGVKTDVICKKNAVYKRAVADPDTMPELPTVFTVDDLQCGDLIRYSVNKKDIAETLEVIYRASTNRVIKDYNTGFGVNLRISAGYVYGKYDDGVKFKVTNNKDDLKNEGSFEYFGNGSFIVMLYDSEEDKPDSRVSIASFGNIMGYEDVGIDLCSRIVMHQNYGSPQLVYIVK